MEAGTVQSGRSGRLRFVGDRWVRHHRARAWQAAAWRAKQDFAIFYSVGHRESGFRTYFDSLWSERPEFSDGDSVFGVSARDRRLVQNYRARRGGYDDLRRHRSDHYADGSGRIRCNEGAFDEE